MIKITAADRYFSLCVRERSNWLCEYSGLYFPEGRRQGLHCSHLFGRRHRSTRWHPDNAFAHSYAAHQYLGANPVLFTQWAEKQLGEGRLAILTEIHNQTVKITKKDEADIAKHYRKQYELMLEQRKKGETGRIEFESYF